MSTQFSPTWNNSGVDFTCIKANVIDTNSGSGSTLLDLQVNGTSKFNILKSGVVNSSGLTLDGDLLFTDATYDIGKSGATRPRDGFFSRNLTLGGTITTGQFGGIYFPNTGGDADVSLQTGWPTQLAVKFGSTAVARFQGGTNEWGGYTSGLMLLAGTVLSWATSVYSQQAGDLILARDAANTLALRNSTSAQTFRLYNTYTSATSFENLQFKANAGAAYQIGSAIGSAGGTNRDINLGYWDNAGTFVNRLSITSLTVDCVAYYNLFASQALLATGGGYVVGFSGTVFGWAAGSYVTTGTTPEFGWYREASNHARLKTPAGANGILTVGSEIITQAVATSGSPTALTITGAAHTTLTTAEVTDGYFNAARTVNFGATGGTIANQRTWRFTAPTFTAAAATTLTTMSTVSISGPPVASTGVTATNAYALDVESGNVRLSSGLIELGTPTTYVRYKTNGITNYQSGTDYPIISWSANSVINAITITGFAYYGLNIQRATGAQTWVTVNQLQGSYGITPRAALDVRGNAIIDGSLSCYSSTTPQSLLVYNTYTSATSGEYGELRWASSVLYIGSNKGSAGGSARDVAITHGGNVVANFLADRFYLGPIADSTATGGNARGQYAVDLQLVRSAASQVASGASSFCSGQYNTASGAYSTAVGYGNLSGPGSFTSGYGNSVTGNWNGAIGYSNTITGGDSGGCFATGKNNTINVSSSHTAFASGYLSSVTSNLGFVHGVYGSATRINQYSHGGDFGFTTGVLGGSQYVRFLLGRKTTDATPTTLMLDGSSTRLTIPSGKTMSCKVTVKGIKSDGSAKARFVRLVEITNVGGTTALDMSPEALGTDYNPSGCVCDITADNTNDALDVSVTGITGETWRWVAVIEGLEIAYGT